MSSNKLENRGRVAQASITISAPIARVWDALVNPDQIKHYMFGTQVVSDWKEGSSIAWRGEWQGKAYEDKGVIIKLEPRHLLQYSHFSPLSGQADTSKNYHTVTIELASKGQQTLASLSQDNNATEDERVHSQKNWQTMLEGLKRYLEQ